MQAHHRPLVRPPAQECVRVALARVRARRLVHAVRRQDAHAVADTLDCEDVPAVAVLLAAMLPPRPRPARLLAWYPGDHALTAYLADALFLAAAVRRWDRAAVARHLGRIPLGATCVALAAMVPADTPDHLLLAWSGTHL